MTVNIVASHRLIGLFTSKGAENENRVHTFHPVCIRENRFRQNRSVDAPSHPPHTKKAEKATTRRKEHNTYTNQNTNNQT